MRRIIGRNGTYDKSIKASRKGGVSLVDCRTTLGRPLKPHGPSNELKLCVEGRVKTITYSRLLGLSLYPFTGEVSTLRVIHIDHDIHKNPVANLRPVDPPRFHEHCKSVPQQHVPPTRLEPTGDIVEVEHNGEQLTVAPADGLVLTKNGRWTRGRKFQGHAYRRYRGQMTHYWICLALHGLPKPGQVVMHVDSKRLDEDGRVINTADNILGWGSIQENNIMSSAKPVRATHEDGRELVFDSMKSTCDTLGMSHNSISRRCHGHTDSPLRGWSFSFVTKK